MSKKKKATKPPARGKKKNQAPKPRRGAKAKQPALPGMAQVRNAALDRLCESIGSAREDKNRLTQEEVGDAQAALKIMLAKGVRAYVHMGVRLTCKKGVDELGITLVKDKSEQGADLGSGGGESPDAGPEPDAQDDTVDDSLDGGDSV